MGYTTDLEGFLDGAVDQDLSDWFAFEVGAARPLHGEAEGALRFGVIARVAGREYASFRLDVNFTTELHPVERVSTHLPLLEFVGLADLDVPTGRTDRHCRNWPGNQEKGSPSVPLSARRWPPRTRLSPSDEGRALNLLLTPVSPTGASYPPS